MKQTKQYSTLVLYCKQLTGGGGGGSSGSGKQEKTEMALPFLNTSRVIQELQISSLLLGLLFVAKLLITLAFNPVEEILWCYHSNETFSAILSHGTIYLVCSANFWVCGWNPMVLTFKWNLFRSVFAWSYSSLMVLQKDIWIFWRISILANIKCILGVKGLMCIVQYLGVWNEGCSTLCLSQSIKHVRVNMPCVHTPFWSW